MKKIFLPVFALFVCLSACKDEENSGNLACSYTEDVTLTNRNANGVDYVCDCEITISDGRFTIEPGVTVEFTGNGGLRVNETGSIRAVGTVDKPITLKGQGGFSGSWIGITFNSNNPENELDYVNISNAGENYFSDVAAGSIIDSKASVVVSNKARINHTTISGSSGMGVALTSSGSFSSFANNNINQSANYPVYMYAGELNNTDLASCSFNANAKNYIALYSKSSGESVSEAVNMVKAPIPYYGTTGLNFTNAVTIAAGTTIIMAANTGIYVEEDQYLAINGTASEPVTIKGESPFAGFWRGILVNTNNPNNIFNYLNISDGGSEPLGFAPNKANIAVANIKPARLTINNCTSTNYDGFQISVSTVDGQLDNNSPTITDIGQH